MTNKFYDLYFIKRNFLNNKSLILLLIFFYCTINILFILIKGFVSDGELSDKIYLTSCVLFFEILYLIIKNNFIKIKFYYTIDYLSLLLIFFVLYFVWNEELIKSYFSIITFNIFIFLLSFSFIIFSNFFLKKEIFSFKKKLDLKFLIVLIFFSFSGLLFQINYLSIQNFFLLIVISFFLILFKFFLENNSKIYDYFFSLLNFFIFFKVFLLSSEKDSFHYSWYLGPINSLVNDYELLKEIVSQYGFLNIYITHLCSEFFKIESNYLLILFIIFFFLIFYLIFYFNLIKLVNLPLSIVTFFLCGLIFANVGFSDLKGSIFIPSSSVFRFLPSLITIILFSKLLIYNNSNNFLYNLFFLISFMTSIFWSIESFFFTIIPIICFFSLNIFYKMNTKLNYFENFLFFLSNYYKVLFLILFTVLFILIFLNLNQKDLLFFYEHAFNPLSSLSVEMKNNKVTLIYVYLLFLNYIIFRDSLDSKNKFLYNILFFSLFVTFSSYFLLRSVDNNVFNLLPFLILITCLMKSNSNAISILRKYSLYIIIYISSLSLILNIQINNKIFFNALFNSNLLNVPKFLENDYKPSFEIQNSINLYSNLPITLITGKTIHNLNINLKNYGYGLPILPLEQFNVLSVTRKQKLLNRFMNLNNKHLILCTFDCKFYSSNDEDRIYDKIFIGNNNLFKIKEVNLGRNVEILYLLTNP